jgi:hypothetical protein
LKFRLSCFVPPVPPEKDLHMPWVSRFSVDIATSYHIVPSSAAWRCRIFCNASGIEHLWSLDIFSLELLREIFWNLLILDGSHSASSCA